MCGAQSPSVNNDVQGTLYPVGICYYVLYPAPHVANVNAHCITVYVSSSCKCQQYSSQNCRG